MKLIVGQGKHFYQVDQENKISRIELPDFSYYNLFPENGQDHRFKLPWELTHQILNDLFILYLKSRNFDLALGLCTVHRKLMTSFYIMIFTRRAYESEKLTVREMASRIAKTLYVCETIDDHLVTPAHGKANFCLRLTRPGMPHLKLPLAPWQFVFDNSVERLVSDLTRGDDEEDRVREFRIGQNVCDFVWVVGKERNGLIEEAQISHPVITLILSDIVGALIPTLRKIQQSPYFIQFTNVLRLIYGPRTRINVMIKDGLNEENPFLSTSSVFVEM